MMSETKTDGACTHASMANEPSLVDDSYRVKAPVVVAGPDGCGWDQSHDHSLAQGAPVVNMATTPAALTVNEATVTPLSTGNLATSSSVNAVSVATVGTPSGVSQVASPRASGVNTATAESQSKQAVFERLGEKVAELAQFIQGRHNVHVQIRKLVAAIQLQYQRVGNFQDEERPKCTPATRERTTQTSSTITLAKVETPSREQKIPHVEGIGGVSRVKRQQTKSPHNPQSVIQKETPESSQAPIGAGEPTATNKWHTVAHRKTKRRKDRSVVQRQRPRPNAIMVTVKEGITYSQVLKRLKEESELAVLGAKVHRVRKSAAGNMILVLDNKESSSGTEGLRKMMDEKIQDMAVTRVLIQEVQIEVKDLDELATAEEVQKALHTQLDSLGSNIEVKVKSIRKAYGGTQTAVVSLPLALAKEALNKGHVRVGWVNCRIREKITVQRCFKCWSFGHNAGKCRGPDRSSKCLKCGEEGHKAKDCPNPPNCDLCHGTSRSDHAASSYRCPMYQKALQSSRK